MKAVQCSNNQRFQEWKLLSNEAIEIGENLTLKTVHHAKRIYLRTNRKYPFVLEDGEAFIVKIRDIQGRIFEFTLVKPELTRVDMICLLTSNVNNSI